MNDIVSSIGIVLSQIVHGVGLCGW